MIVSAQTNMRGWHANGQTWLAWEDTAPTPEAYRIYKSSSQISDISSAQLVGRIFQNEWEGARLQKLDPALRWTIPDAAGGTYTLASNEALFVYTPHGATTEYFAVVKDGETVVGSDNRVGPITQTITPVQCHLQTSGTDRDFSYRVYAHWIDGRDDWNAGRSDYPVMGNEHFNGVGHVFCVWDPTDGGPAEPIPAVIFLHGGGSWYGSVNPNDDNSYDAGTADAFVISMDDSILIKSTDTTKYQKTYWIGYWEGYDRFQLPSTQPVPDNGLVVDYTMRRIDWELGWILDNENVDPKRVSLLGGSMGGRGANYQARVHPERYAAYLTLSAGLVPLDPSGVDPIVGSAAQNVQTNLPGSPGVCDVMNPKTPLSDTERDIPFGKCVSGRNDPMAVWSAEQVQMYKDLNDTGWGSHIYWDERGHVYTEGSYWADSPRLKAKELTLQRSDRSFPAFFNDDQDTFTAGRQPDMGNGDPADGATSGTWGGYYDWNRDTLVDSPRLWEATIFLVSSSSNANDIATFNSSTADVAIRRPQQFAPPAGTTVDWSLTRLSDSQLLQSGQSTVAPNGLVIVSGLIIYKEPSRLSISSAVYNYYFPYFIAGSDYWYGVGLRNCSDSQNASVSAVVYDQNGNIITTESETLPARGQNAWVVGAGLQDEGWVKVNSNQPLTGLCFLGAAGYANYMADITLIHTLSQTLYVPHVAQDSEWDTTILVCNPNNSSTTVTLTFVDTQGNALYTNTHTISGNGSGKYELFELVEGTEQPRGSVEISASQGIAAFALYTNLKWGGYCYSGISAVDPADQ